MKFKKIIAITVLISTAGIVSPVYANENIENNKNNSAIVNTEYKNSKFNVGQGVLWPEQVNAPFVDMVAWVNKPDYNNNGVADLERISVDTGVKYFNLGFINATGKGVSNGTLDWGWGGYTVLSEKGGANDSQYQGIKQSIKELRTLGGDVTVSFGGLNGVPFWSATQDVEVLYNTYLEIVEGYGLTRIDLDIEGGAQNKEYNRTNAKAIKKLQEKTGVNVVLTLPVLPSGLTDVQLNVLEVYLAEGVNVEVVNLMTMCYGSSTLLPGENYGTGSLRAVDSTMEQLKDYYKKFANTTLTTEQAYGKLGTTPSIGYEGSGHPIFTTEWSKLVVDHAIEKKLAMTSFWSMNRDAQLTANQGVTSQYQFTNIFKNFGTTGQTVDAKPAIYGVENLTIKKGESFDKLKGITATDKEDGNLTNKIKVTGDVDVTKEGTYKLVYSVTDSYGNTTSIERIVIVKDFSGALEISFNFEVTQDWGSGGGYKMTLKNNTGKDINGWNIEMNFDKKIDSYWNGGFKADGNLYSFTNPSWSPTWKAGETLVLEGACQGGIGSSKPTNIKVNGIEILGSENGNNGGGTGGDTGNNGGDTGNGGTVVEKNWEAGISYKKGDLVKFSGKSYECLQAHTSLVGWEPTATLSLWKSK